jgi:hypothetical protein
VVAGGGRKRCTREAYGSGVDESEVLSRGESTRKKRAYLLATKVGMSPLRVLLTLPPSLLHRSLTLAGRSLEAMGVEDCAGCPSSQVEGFVLCC